MTSKPYPEVADLRSLLSTPDWLVEETEFEVKKLNVFETKFTVGNGYMGTRGSLEEGHDAGLPGTYLNGVFDHFDSFIVDLVNAPDWTELSMWVEGEKLSIQNCQILDYYRALDLQQGLLYRFTRFQDRHGRISRYESMRYASLADRHFFEIKATLTPENFSGEVRVEGPINGKVFNLDLEPAYKQKPKFIPEVKWQKWTKSKHLQQVDAGELSSGIFLEMKTMDRPHHIIYGSQLTVKDADGQMATSFQHERASQSFTFKVEQDRTYHIEKTVSIFSSRDLERGQLKDACQKVLQENLARSFDQRMELHQEAWRKKWDDCEVTIEGDVQANYALKFNIYHLLIAANEQDHKANIGAKSLSGEGYKGHVFWDTEIFLLPFYIFTQPETAKALLMYRYHTMKGAKEYAQQDGYQGARFPWESADTGHETTPPWTADGKERIWTGEREIHITAAVVFGVISYYQATGDLEFLTNYGAPILFETARFWNSRLEYNEEKDRYELTNVEGPDEFHELVDNSVYTNWLTKWNLEQSAEVYHLLKSNHLQRFQHHEQALDLKPNEVEQWKQKADKVYIPYDSEKKLVEQFEGYFQLDEVPISEWDENKMPVYPEGYDHFNCHSTTLIKQPDVLMLMYMLPDHFTDEVKKINYDYYEARTMHKSSLSPSIHTIMGIETDNLDMALQYFERSAYVDLINNQGNTEWGMHIASAGGTWQAIVNGFAGLRVKSGKLTFKPWLPPKWQSISFKIQWQGDPIRITIDHQKIKITWHSQAQGNLELSVMDQEIKLEPNLSTTISYA